MTTAPAPACPSARAGAVATLAGRRLAAAPARAAHLLAAAFAKALFTMALLACVALSRPAVASAYSAPAQLCHAPSLNVASRQAVSGDLSAGVRVHRDGGASFDVWLVTPASARWDPVRAAQPLAKQLARVQRPRGDAPPSGRRLVRLPPPRALRPLPC